MDNVYKVPYLIPITKIKSLYPELKEIDLIQCREVQGETQKSILKAFKRNLHTNIHYIKIQSSSILMLNTLIYKNEFLIIQQIYTIIYNLLYQMFKNFYNILNII
ncbi:hypothetical protein PPERSA_12356 [Pseudocohnilembus persalinus]|uniref:Uncharacterized protein n=1 Tax=Pseudocohnilembus persalinus TaxID=266149 RepID=A0A0V0R100_PSEPJ|nr:hypothetical protein PPERSA_12356 [Pseudocohnilembus persalinus]|eukprot:KRX08201.1 hypothetical protein PPERSA_12356 [Pseudocohnilembus persalinus]